MIDLVALPFVLIGLTGWLERRERETIAYLVAENRLLRQQLGCRRLRLTEAERRRLAIRAHRVGRAALSQIAAIATPDTLLRWHRQLAGFHSIRINAQWRVVFRWTSAGPTDVDIRDDH